MNIILIEGEHHSVHSFLYEIDRKNLVGKTKVQSPNRYNKRLGYKAGGFDGIDPEQLLANDLLATQVHVGDYICNVAYRGVLKRLLEVLREQPKPNVTLQSVIRAVTRAMDNTDIYVNCTCPDFQYRFAYWATKYDYKYGPPQNIPANKTNPTDNIGSVCKHLTALLSNKRWLVKVSSIVNNFIKSNIEDVREALGVTEDEMYVFSRKSKKSDNKLIEPSVTLDGNEEDIGQSPDIEIPEDNLNNSEIEDNEEDEV